MDCCSAPALASQVFAWHPPFIGASHHIARYGSCRARIQAGSEFVFGLKAHGPIRCGAGRADEESDVVLDRLMISQGDLSE